MCQLVNLPNITTASKVFRLGVRQKIVLILLATLIITLSLSGWLALRSQKEDFLKETNRRGVELTHFAAQSLAFSVVGYDYHTIELWLQDLVKSEDVVYAKVLSRKGNVMAEASSMPANTNNVVWFNQDIRVNTEVVGKLHLGLSTERIGVALNKQRSYFITRELFVILAIALVEFLALSYIIIRPIGIFLRGLHERLGTEYEHRLPIPITSTDEFGNMAHEFNRLHTQLIDTNRKLRSNINLADEKLQQAHNQLMKQSDELKHVNKELQRLTITDSQTGLYNRRYFDELMEHEIALAMRHNETNSIVVIDIDYFKKINDQYGHDNGDAVIRHVGLLLQNRVRKTDAICRYGGDEFFILCRRANNKHVTELAEQLRLAVAQTPLVSGNQTIPISISIGTATIPDRTPIVSSKEFFRRADMALYFSKSWGRNRVTHYSTLDQEQKIIFEKG